MVAVIALVSDPRCHSSSTVTETGVPALRTPVAPIASSPLLVTTAPASAGSLYFRRMGSSKSATRFGAEPKPIVENIRINTSSNVRECFILGSYAYPGQLYASSTPQVTLVDPRRHSTEASV